MREISSAAVTAAIGAARKLRLGSIEPVILHESRHVSIRLAPLPVVARVVRADDAEAGARLRRELAVTRHLAAKATPVVGPTDEPPAGPYFHGCCGLTLWQFVEHVRADGDNPEQVANAATALRRVHEALSDFPGALPSWIEKIEQCRRLLQDGSRLPAIAAADRRFLLATYGNLLGSLDAHPGKPVPIHGDALLGNVFITPGSALWSDFEDACLGPREWDIGWLPDIDLAPFEPVDRDLLSVLLDLRSLCVSVWCWDKYGTPEEREAAGYHLGRLKERFA